MSTTTPAAPVTAHDPAARTGVAVGAVIAGLGALAYISTVVFGSGSSVREEYQSPLGIIGSVVAAVGALVILLALPHVRIGLPAWPAVLVSAGLFFAGGFAWLSGTAMLGFANATDDVAFEAAGASGWTLLYVLPKVIGVVGLAAMAIIGWRRRAFSRGAAVLLLLAAVASLLPPFPPGVLLTSIALAWVVRSAPLR